MWFLRLRAGAALLLKTPLRMRVLPQTMWAGVEQLFLCLFHRQAAPFVGGFGHGAVDGAVADPSVWLSFRLFHLSLMMK